MTKQEAGKLGGQSTYQKYGREYMSKIGRQGAVILWSTYRLCPDGTSRFIFVKRSK